MKHNTIYYFLLLIVLGLSNSCKKESESYIITGQLVNCDGTPYANQSVLMKRSNDLSNKVKINTDAQGVFNFEYQAKSDEIGFYELLIDSTIIVNDLYVGHNYRLNKISINPSINVVLKIKALNLFSSDYIFSFESSNNVIPPFEMNGPFKDTIIGQYNIELHLPYNASFEYSNNNPIVPIYSVSIYNRNSNSTEYIDQQLMVSICPERADTAIIIIK